MIRKSLLLLVFILLPQLAAPQHEPNWVKTVSYWITLKECDVSVSKVILTDTSGGPRTFVNKELVIIQWSFDIEGYVGEGKNFALMDLLARLAQKFHKMIYISPAGVSFTPIGKAPIRKEYTKEWNDPDKLAMTNWMNSHNVYARDMQAKYLLLVKKGSVKIPFPLILRKDPTCTLPKEDGEI
jgi:hypothetical protein